MNTWKQVAGYVPLGVAVVIVLYCLAYQWWFKDTPKELWGLAGTAVGLLFNKAFDQAGQ